MVSALNSTVQTEDALGRAVRNYHCLWAKKKNVDFGITNEFRADRLDAGTRTESRH